MVIYKVSRQASFFHHIFLSTTFKKKGFFQQIDVCQTTVCVVFLSKICLSSMFICQTSIFLLLACHTNFMPTVFLSTRYFSNYCLPNKSLSNTIVSLTFCRSKENPLVVDIGKEDDISSKPIDSIWFKKVFSPFLILILVF